MQLTHSRELTNKLTFGNLDSQYDPEEDDDFEDFLLLKKRPKEMFPRFSRLALTLKELSSSKARAGTVAAAVVTVAGADVTEGDASRRTIQCETELSAHMR